MQLPTICSYEEATIKSTIYLIEESEEQGIYTVNFSATGSGIVTHQIDLVNLVVNQEYILGVVVNVNGLKLQYHQQFGKL